MLEHPVLVLRCQQQRLDRHGRKHRNNSHQFLWNALRIGNVCDDEPGHVSQGGDGFGSRIALKWSLFSPRRVYEHSKIKNVNATPTYHGGIHGSGIGGNSVTTTQTHRLERHSNRSFRSRSTCIQFITIRRSFSFPLQRREKESGYSSYHGVCRRRLNS